MIIELFNIPAISVSNELYFASQVARDVAFHNYYVKSVTSPYYPVQYKNKIKLSIDDVSFSTVFNYVAINMYNRRWFYFVDSFEYVNEKIYYMNIALDTVQTFYFDINFRRFEKTRKLGYSGIRDNISLDPTLYPYSIRNYDYGKPYVVVVQYNTRLVGDCKNVLATGATVDNSIGWEGFKENIIYCDDGTFYTDGLKTMYLLMPADLNDMLLLTDYLGNTGLISYGSRTNYIINAINKLANDPNVVNMFVTKHLPRSITYGTFTYQNHTYTGYVLGTPCQLFSNYLIKTGNNAQLTDSSIKHYADWIKYGSFDTPARAMCDTNYTQICIGELNDYTPVPLELLEPETTYDLYYMFDICSGVRTYKVDSSELEKIHFRHVCNSIENMQTFNENYNTYLMQNKGTLTTGVALQKTQAWVNFANQVFNQNAAKAFSGAMQGGVAGGIVAGAEATVTSGVDMFTTMFGIDKSVQAQRENAYYAPDTVKTGNNFTNDIINSFIDKIIIVTRVADYNDIEYIREYSGYLCHDTTYNQTLNDLIVTSTQVNDKYLIMGECEVYLTAFNVSIYLADIKSRFKSGIRFYVNVADLGK